VSLGADICHDELVVYASDADARKEATDYPISENQTARLREQCARKTAELEDDGVRGHTVRFSVTAWNQPPGLPDSIPRTGRISRGDVFDIGDRVRDGTLHAADLLAASFVWGWGTTGYGPRRYRDVCAAAGDQLESSLQHVLTEINKDPGTPDPSRATPTCTVGSTTRTGRHPGKSRGPGCMDSARRSSPSFCTSPHPMH
jgi:hypothetical protein